MGAVQRAVHRLEEPEKLHAFLSDLGRRHDKNGAKLEYIDVSLKHPSSSPSSSLLNYKGGTYKSLRS